MKKCWKDIVAGRAVAAYDLEVYNETTLAVKQQIFNKQEWTTADKELQRIRMQQ
jgi:hypothetical protein